MLFAHMVAHTLTAVFVALALLHFYWAVAGGADPGGFVPTDGNRPVFTPGPLTTAAVGVGLLTAALVVTCRAGGFATGLPRWLAQLGTWAIALLFAARAVGDFRYVGFFKRLRGSRFALRDTWIFSPLCVAIAAGALWVALTSP